MQDNFFFGWTSELLPSSARALLLPLLPRMLPLRGGEVRGERGGEGIVALLVLRLALRWALLTRASRRWEPHVQALPR